MASPVNPPRGMRDFLPAEKARRERVLAIIRGSFRAHGFDEIETPAVEDTARLHAGLGGDNEKLGYAILKRGLDATDLAESATVDGGYELSDISDLGLRFDLTVPLSRFYASHRAELPSVFRSIQIGPAWRAERPQKGRYRQFVQCDIDIIGETSLLAEVELIVAVAGTLDALGLTGCTIRLNDRRLLESTLATFGFAPASRELVLVVLDKLDKVFAEGVIAELREKVSGEAKAIDALESFLTRVRTTEFVSFGERAIRRELPGELLGELPGELPGGLPGAAGRGIDETAVRELVELGDAVEAAGVDRSLLRFDPFLVRGMGYYTGTIFEVSHPDLGYSLAGGGRYDGMIGRFLGTQVPAVGFSLGFERIVDLVEFADSSDGGDSDAVALLYDPAVPFDRLAALKNELLATGARVRLEKRPRNPKQLLDQLAASGFTRYAYVGSGSGSGSDSDGGSGSDARVISASELEFRPIAAQ